MQGKQHLPQNISNCTIIYPVVTSWICMCCRNSTFLYIKRAFISTFRFIQDTTLKWNKISAPLQLYKQGCDNTLVNTNLRNKSDRLPHLLYLL